MFFMVIWFIVGYSIVFLAISTTNFKSFVHFFFPTFKPTLQPMKRPLDFLYTHCILSGRELENLDKPMVLHHWIRS